MSGTWQKRYGPHTFTFRGDDSDDSEWERTFYETSEAKARSLAQAWAARQGYTLVL
jgi:hypothetical protein